MKWIKVLSSTILASAITLSATPISHAAPNQTTTQTVAFDASHGQTAGALIGSLMVAFPIMRFNASTRLYCETNRWRI